MGLFNKNKDVANLLLQEPRPVPTVSYDTVIDYLIGLSDAEFDKVIKAATVHRKADKEVCKILHVKYAPSTFIAPKNNVETVPAHVNHVNPKTILDDDDEINLAFLDSDDDEQEYVPDEPTNRPISKKPKK